MMRDVEIVSSLTHVLGPKEKEKGPNYVMTELTRLWKIVLLNQFHDVLPGTSINAVCQALMLTILFCVILS